MWHKPFHHENGCQLTPLIISIKVLIHFQFLNYRIIAPSNYHSMKRIIAVLVLICVSATTWAQNHQELDEAVNKFQSLYNSKQFPEISGMLSDRIKTLLPEEKMTATLQQLHTQYGELKSYSHQKQEQQLGYYKATFAQTTMTLIVSLDEHKKLDAFRFTPWKDEDNKEESDFSYKSSRGRLYGSFAIPTSDKPVPVVLIIAGSGPTDRNGNQDNVNSNAYKLIADSLKNAGIASLRYDKRGVGESAAALKDESQMRFEDAVSDAVGIIKELKSDKRFSSVIILGHSEGSLVGMLAAAQEPVQAFISVAGIANSADKVIIRQVYGQSEELGIKAAYMLDNLKNNKPIGDPGPELSALFRPSAQPYLLSWIKYDPQTEIKKLSIPVLILQGTTDLQVSEGEATTLKEAYPKATLKIIKGMNHVLKTAPEDRVKNMATYNMPALPLAPGFMPSIIGFVGTGILLKNGW